MNLRQSDLSYACIIKKSDKIFRHLQIWNETVWEVLTFRVVSSIHELIKK